MADPMWKKKGSPVVNHFTNPRFVGASADLGDLLTGGQMILWDAMPDPAGVAVVSPGGAIVDDPNQT